MCKVRAQEDVKSHWLHFGIPPPDSRIDNTHDMLNRSLCHPPRQGQPSPWIYAPPPPTSPPSTISLTSTWPCTWGGTALWWPATLSWAATYTVTFTFQFEYLSYRRRKIIGGQLIQIRGGRSALYGEQKRQLRGGKCVKLRGGKCAEGKWTTTN